MRRLMLAVCGALLCACSGAKPKPVVLLPTLQSQELEVVSQSLTDFAVRLVAKFEPTDPVSVTRVKYELVVDGAVVKSGEEPMDMKIPADATAELHVDGTHIVAHSAAELKALDAKGGNVLVALRGVFITKSGFENATGELPFARSREIRLPRLPKVKLKEVVGYKNAEDDAQFTVYLSVENPNPFQLNLSRLTYLVTVAGTKVGEGVFGAGDKINASATGVFEERFNVTRETHGKDVSKLIKTLRLPYSISGELTAPMMSAPYEFKGVITLNPSN